MEVSHLLHQWFNVFNHCVPTFSLPESFSLHTTIQVVWHSERKSNKIHFLYSSPNIYWTPVYWPPCSWLGIQRWIRQGPSWKRSQATRGDRFKAPRVWYNECYDKSLNRALREQSHLTQTRDLWGTSLYTRVRKRREWRKNLLGRGGREEGRRHAIFEI